MIRRGCYNPKAFKDPNWEPKVIRRKRAQPEQALQRAVVNYLALCVGKPPFGPAWTARNPVSFKSRIVAGISQRMGMKPGWPDLDLVWQGRYYGVELKAPKGRVSEAQNEAIVEIGKASGIVFICRSLNEFKQILAVIGVLTKEVA